MPSAWQAQLPSEEAFRLAKAAVARALELDPNLAEAHATLGHLKYACDYDWAGAEQELKRAIELNPNSGEAYDYYGLMLSSLERYDEALEMQRRAHELDPLAHRMDLVDHLSARRPLRGGLARRDARAGGRAHLPLAHLTLGWVQLLTGKADQGMATLEKGLSLSPENTLYLAQVGQAYGMVGRLDESRAMLRRLEELSSRTVRLALSPGVRPYRAGRQRAGDGLAGAGLPRAGRWASSG